MPKKKAEEVQGKEQVLDSVQVPVKVPVPAETKVVFYWRKFHSPRFIIKDKDGRSITRVARNNVLTLDQKNKDDSIVISYLRAHSDNEKNGGIEFGELDARPIGSEDSSPIGERIDRLLEMEFPALATLSGGGLTSGRKSRGTLIAEILKIK